MKFSDKYSNIFCKFYVNNYDSILNNFDNYLTKYNASYKMFRNKLNLDINVNKIRSNKIDIDVDIDRISFEHDVKKESDEYTFLKIYLKEYYKRILLKDSVISKNKNYKQYIKSYPYINMLINPITKINLSNHKGFVNKVELFNKNIKTINDINTDELALFEDKCNQLFDFIQDRYKINVTVAFIIYNKNLKHNNNKLICRAILENKVLKYDKSLEYNLLSSKELSYVFNPKLLSIFFDNQNLNKNQNNFNNDIELL